MNPSGALGRSWVAMTFDGRGRLIVSPQEGPLRRLTPGEQPMRVETLPAPVGDAQGLLWAFDSLYVNGKGPSGCGFYRLRDRDGSGRLDDVRLLRAWPIEMTEHGPHGITVNAVAPSGATRMTAGLYERSGQAPPPEENPALNAPLVAYLASEGAAHVNGQILGRSEYAYTLFQQPKQIAWMWNEGGWTPAQVAERFDKGLGLHLQQLGMVMPASMQKK